MARPVCRRCRASVAVHEKGLCDGCHEAQSAEYEPTEEEVSRCVEEQYRHLPAWWDEDVADDEE